jgi:hypothetical protein
MATRIRPIGDRLDRLGGVELGEALVAESALDVAAELGPEIDAMLHGRNSP